MHKNSEVAICCVCRILWEFGKVSTSMEIKSHFLKLLKDGVTKATK